MKLNAGRQMNLTAVLQIGKADSCLVLLDDAGIVLDGRETVSTTREAFGYRALDSDRTQEWLVATLASLGHLRAHIRRIITTTHGAAMAPMCGNQLALPIPDYEFPGFADPALLPDQDPFAETLSSELPAGMNAARQFAWLQAEHPALFSIVDAILPYPQYWAWFLSGERCWEISSLGWHTQLWNPTRNTFSTLAVNRGWSRLFRENRRAWEVAGVIRPDLAKLTGLPGHCMVYASAHDVNARLARYLREWPSLGLVTTGADVVAMTAGTAHADIDPARGAFGHVSVRGDLVPASHIACAAHLDASLLSSMDEQTTLEILRRLVERQSQGGLPAPPAAIHGAHSQQARCAGPEPSARAAGEDVNSIRTERAAFEAFHCAQETAALLDRLGAFAPIIIEGPFAASPMFLKVLAALVPSQDVHVSVDPVDSAVRGSWMLTRWTSSFRTQPRTARILTPPSLAADLRQLHIQ